MFRRLGRHIQANAVAYLALFFAIGGGGGYAVAATTASSTTIHACVSKKNGALYVAKKCSKSERALTFNQRGPAGATGPAGAAQPGIIGEVSAGSSFLANGMTITPAQTSGEYDVDVTACNGHTAILSATPIDGIGDEPSGPPEIEVDPDGNTAVVSAGTIQNGNFVLSGGQDGLDFELSAVCAS